PSPDNGGGGPDIGSDGDQNNNTGDQNPGENADDTDADDSADNETEDHDGASASSGSTNRTTSPNSGAEPAAERPIRKTVSQQRIINGRYEVGELIGRGGMADVYMGLDQRLGRTVAIKMMRPDLARDPQFQTRFRREAHASAALNHPNTVAVFDTGEEELPATGQQPRVACPYMVMEHVDGDTLRALLRKGEVTTDQAVEWTEGILAAVSYSHENNIVHRDIKPGNVMVDESGAVKVMDFGIARALSD